MCEREDRFPVHSLILSTTLVVVSTLYFFNEYTGIDGEIKVNYTYFLFMCLFVASLIQLARDILKVKEVRVNWSGAQLFEGRAPAFLIILVMVLYAVGLNYFGYLASTIAMLVVLQVLFKRRNKVLVAAYSLVVAMAMYIIFQYGFSVPLP